LRLTRYAASAALIALILLCLAWELWLAPLRPGGSFLALKAAPLALPLAGILSGKRYTYQWSSMFILAWLAEGAVRASTEPGVARTLATLEAMLALLFFAAAVSYSRATKTRSGS
jgi:uncharacterized membrane protein